MVPFVSLAPDIVDTAVNAIEVPFGFSTKTDLALSAAATVAAVVPDASVAAAKAKISARLGKIGAKRGAVKGGTYILKNADGKVIKTGRTNNLGRRQAEHARDHRETSFEADKRKDDYAAQRGCEQDLHDAHPTAHAENGGLDRINGISPTNPN